MDVSELDECFLIIVLLIKIGDKFLIKVKCMRMLSLQVIIPFGVGIAFGAEVLSLGFCSLFSW